MRRILIDEDLHKRVVDFYASTSIIEPINCLKNLSSNLSKQENNYSKKKKYLEKLINELSFIVTAKPHDIGRLINEFENILHHEKISKSFHKKITSALQYNGVRKALLPLYQKLNIKACVYCNAQLTTVVELDRYKKVVKAKGKKKGDVKTYSGRFELDHHYPKSDYPFLSVSFYNLFPCCSNCNKHKSSNTSLFNLYTEDINHLNPFRFKIDDNSKDVYLKTNNVNDLQFEFVHVSGDINLLKNHKKLFKIEQLYETQKDIFEELVHISNAYNEASKQNLVDTYKGLFKDTDMINRILIGNYDKPEDIHKRPLAKFTQDIARDLKLIK